MRLLPALSALLFLAACSDKDNDTGNGGNGGDGGTNTDGGSTDGGGDGGTDTTLLADDFVFTLNTTSGCADTWMQAWDGEGRVGLQLYVDGLLAEAVAAGAPVIKPYTVGVDNFDLIVEVAEPVEINYCTDAISEREVFETWTATSGSAVLGMMPPMADDGPGRGTIELSMVDFEDGAGHTVSVPGWFSGEIIVQQGWGG